MVGTKEMHDFGHLCYLEMQKTGSSFVNVFLKKCCTLPEVKHQKHMWVRSDYDSKKFYFITIRHPLSLYSSLYRYGLDKLGGFYNRLQRAGKTIYYETFESFCSFMLDPHNAIFFGQGYNEKIAEQIGFMTFRFMKLSLQFPLKKINNALLSGNDLVELERKFIINSYLKNEQLCQDLKSLATIKFPEYFNGNDVIKFLDNAPKYNSSKTPEESLISLRDATSSKLFEREALLLSRY